MVKVIFRCVGVVLIVWSIGTPFFKKKLKHLKVRVPSVLMYGIGTLGTHGTRTFDFLYFLFAKSRQQNGYDCDASHNATVAERYFVCVL